MARRPVTPETPLTAMQESLAQGIASGLSPVNAAEQAGYSSRAGRHILARKAYETARLPHVAARIEELRAIAANATAREIAALPESQRVIAEVTAKQFDASQERLALELARIAFADIKDLYDADGNLLPPHKLPEDVRRVIQEVTVTERPDGSLVHRYKLASKQAALDSLADRLWPVVQRTENKNLNMTFSVKLGDREITDDDDSD